LDGLSEYVANTVSMLAALDFLKGPHQIAWRLHEWLNGHTLTRENNPWCVCAALATALKVMLDSLKPLGDPKIDVITEDQRGSAESGSLLGRHPTPHWVAGRFRICCVS
jgi:hypothetical protein